MDCWFGYISCIDRNNLSDTKFSVPLAISLIRASANKFPFLINHETAGNKFFLDCHFSWRKIHYSTWMASPAHRKIN